MKFQKVLERYDDLYSMDMFGESTEGHKYRTPFYSVKRIDPNSKEDMELISKLPWITGNFDFDDEDKLCFFFSVVSKLRAKKVKLLSFFRK